MFYKFKDKLTTSLIGALLMGTALPLLIKALGGNADIYTFISIFFSAFIVFLVGFMSEG